MITSSGAALNINEKKIYENQNSKHTLDDQNFQPVEYRWF
jgi:hypothetical protein